jgi:hypothetical protein
MQYFDTHVCKVPAWGDGMHDAKQAIPCATLVQMMWCSVPKLQQLIHFGILEERTATPVMAQQ